MDNYEKCKIYTNAGIRLELMSVCGKSSPVLRIESVRRDENFVYE